MAEFLTILLRSTSIVLPHSRYGISYGGSDLRCSKQDQTYSVLRTLQGIMCAGLRTPYFLGFLCIPSTSIPHSVRSTGYFVWPLLFYRSSSATSPAPDAKSEYPATCGPACTAFMPGLSDNSPAHPQAVMLRQRSRQNGRLGLFNESGT